MVQLTAGSCQRLWNATPEDIDIFNAKHTVQFLSIKKVGSAATPNNLDRYRVVMSDGIHYMQAMLATPLNAVVQEGKILRNSVVTLEKISCNYVQERRLVIILDVSVPELNAEKIGEPIPIEPSQDQSTSNIPAVAEKARAGVSVAKAAPAETSNLPVQKPPPPPVKGHAGTIYPIEGLSPYQNNWTIKARVIQKSDMRTWSNQRGEGKLFNVTLMDDSGEIRGTAFNLVADELYPRLEEGKVYYISKARVNLAKKKFSNVPNDYELNFERNTEVEECLETTNVPKVKYNFVSLDALNDLAKDAICDVIGVIKEAGPISQIQSQKQNRQIVKRELTLVDKSNYAVRLTLWGKQAEQYNAEDSPVIAFKGVKVGDFGGRTLSMITSSTMEVNPDMEECFSLRGWFDNQGSDQNFKAYTGGAVGSGLDASFSRADIRSLDEVKQAGYGMPDKPENFSARATIMHIKPENISYPACPTQGCNKKVVEDGGKWNCEKCGKRFDAPEHRYIISMAVADYSGQAWLQGFNDVGVEIFDMTANALLEIRDENPQNFDKILHNANCNTYNFSCRAKQDTFNETPRIRYGISRMQPLDYKEEARAMRDLLYSAWAK